MGPDNHPRRTGEGVGSKSKHIPITRQVQLSLIDRHRIEKGVAVVDIYRYRRAPAGPIGPPQGNHLVPGNRCLKGVRGAGGFFRPRTAIVGVEATGISPRSTFSEGFGVIVVYDNLGRRNIILDDNGMIIVLDNTVFCVGC